MGNVNPRKYQKHCPTCDKDFFTGRKNHKFCSQLCASHSIAKYIDTTVPPTCQNPCLICSKLFTVQEFYAKGVVRRGGKRPKYCSRVCVGKAKKNRPKPDTMECSVCKVVMPYTLEYFSKNSHKNSTFGMNRQCKKCIANLYREYTKEYQRKLRLQVLTAYSNGPLACVCCGESHHEFLSLDHVFNDGAQERKHTGQLKLFYRLRRQKFPKGRYQTLCMNCNHAKAKYGCCPHQKDKALQPV